MTHRIALGLLIAWLAWAHSAWAQTATNTVPTATNTVPTPTRTKTPTVTPTFISCMGDCDSSGTVTAAERDLCTSIFNGQVPLSACPACSSNGVSVSSADLNAVIASYTNGCADATPTKTGTVTRTPTAPTPTRTKTTVPATNTPTVPTATNTPTITNTPTLTATRATTPLPTYGSVPSNVSVPLVPVPFVAPATPTNAVTVADSCPNSGDRIHIWWIHIASAGVTNVGLYYDSTQFDSINFAAADDAWAYYGGFPLPVGSTFKLQSTGGGIVYRGTLTYFCAP